MTNNGVTSPQTYDASGNLTSDVTHTYQYDGENRVASVDNNGATYSCDSANRRVKKVVGSTTTYYVWEGAQVIAEYSNARAGSGGTNYYLADRLSTRMITDGNGAFKGTHDHLPFGEDAGTSGTPEKHGFTNYERDTETARDYAISRQYATTVGRFFQADVMSGQISHPKTLNRFAYSYNDPINFYDPDGELGIIAVGALVVLGSAVTGAVFGAIFPPSGHGRWAGAGIGFLSGGANGLFAVLGAPRLSAPTHLAG